MIETRNLIKSFKDGDKETQVLKGINFKAVEGEFISIMGRSGAGKSTFLYQISLLDEPTSGEIIIAGQNAHLMTPDEKTSFRLSTFGYVFQDYALLPEMTALENVALPLLMQGLPRGDAYKKAEAALVKMRMQERMGSIPTKLSGGEQQRVSIARAIAHDPAILFADEPTANLDNDSSQNVMNIFKELHAAGQTIIMVTHEEEYAKLAQRIVRVDNGLVV